MSDFKAKMHQIRFPGTAYSAPPDSLAVIKGAYTSNGREGYGKGRGREKEGGWNGRKGRGE